MLKATLVSADLLRPRVLSRGAAKLTALSVEATLPSKTPSLFESAAVAHRRRKLRLRTGMIAVKRGMVPMFDTEGIRHACTVLEVDRVQVVDVRTREKNGYYAVQLGYGARKFKNVTRPLLGHFARAQVSPKSHVCEFQIRDWRGLLPLGTELKADHFRVGQYVDLKSKSKGKGFQGVMKRWGFKGQRATHGTSLTHRHAGATGQHQDPGRVLPGKKMAGHMGDKNNTIFNAKVMMVDVEKGIIVVKGHVSGADGSYIKVLDAIKKPLPMELYIPKKQKTEASK